MRRTGIVLPVITIDPDLVKSTAERNKDVKSDLGQRLGIRSPVNQDVDPIAIPKFTKQPVPDNYYQKAEGPSDYDQFDTTTPLAELIKPKPVLRTKGQIERWLRQNYANLKKPMHYVGHEANTDSPSIWETADVRVLVVRLSSYDSVNGSLTHGALAQLARNAGKPQKDESGKEVGEKFQVFTDFAYMPALQDDAQYLRSENVPWLFGRTSKRHPLDFDIIVISCALTMETWNIIPALVNSGVAPFKTMRTHDAPLADRTDEPVILIGGVVSDFIESLYGEVAGESCVPDITIIGDGEYTLPLAVQHYYKCKKAGLSKRDFFKLGHDLPQDEHFERDGRDRKLSWWYEPDLYEHVYKKAEKPYEWTEWEVELNDRRELVNQIPHPRSTVYNELIDIRRKEGCEYAAEVGNIKRAVMRDLNVTPVWEEAPLQYDGSLGPSVDIQISSGCLSGGLCSFCFLPGTPVVLANGATTPIEMVEPGTAILTPDGKARPVVTRFEREVAEEIGVLQTAELEEPLKVTLNHRLPSLSKEAFKAWDGQQPLKELLVEREVRDLALGDYLVGPETTPSHVDLLVQRARGTGGSRAGSWQVESPRNGDR